MYKNIVVLLDNSPYSLWGLDISIAIAKRSGGKVVGNHVYAAKLHEDRFTQMEEGLPEKYQQPEELGRQREIHATLIEKGLRIISDSYLDVFQSRCEKHGVAYERKMMEGRNYVEAIRDINESGYDLVALGAKGLGEVATTQLGSVCERVARGVSADTLVIKNDRSILNGKILVAVDGSGESYAAVATGLELAKSSGAELTAVAVYDPNFHYVVFDKIAKVLSEEAGQIFKFKEQEILHKEIIDSGLEKIYADNLKVAQKMADKAGVPLKTEILAGKPFDALITRLQKDPVDLLILGRLGIHSDNGLKLGSNSENLLRNAPVNLLLISRKYLPQFEKKSSDPLAIEWEPEAEEMLNRAPKFVRNFIRKHMESMAIEKNTAMVTREMMAAARKKFMGI